jgi:hypothetical protein
MITVPQHSLETCWYYEKRSTYTLQPMFFLNLWIMEFSYTKIDPLKNKYQYHNVALDIIINNLMMITVK